MGITQKHTHTKVSAIVMSARVLLLLLICKGNLKTFSLSWELSQVVTLVDLFCFYVKSSGVATASSEDPLIIWVFFLPF